MNKELLTVELRYHSVPKSEYSSGYESKTITIGVYDSLEEAVKEGNKVLDKLSSKFKFRDLFGTNNGVFGSATRLVCDFCHGYPEVFCKIEQLKYDDICKVINEVFDSEDKYKKWKETEI